LSKSFRVFAAIAALLLLIAAIVSSQLAFQKILHFRALERIPLTQALTSTDGEVQLQGRAEAADSVLQSPDTKTNSVYYRYLVEEEYRDCEGHKKWRTIRNESAAINFYLRDDSGTVLIRVQDARTLIDWSVPRKFRQERGKYRYSEWRIDVGDRINLFGWLSFVSAEANVVFTQPGDYLPIISSYSADKERGDISWWAVVLLSAAISALAFTGH